MANKLEYIFSLQDRMSAKIGNISASSDKMIGKFSELKEKQGGVKAIMDDTGRSMGALKEKIDLLQRERDWIPANNIEGIRAYNKEIKALNKEVQQLESLNGGKFKKWASEAFAAIPGSNLISNPLVAIGAAIGTVGKQAMSFDESMAKVNITAQLEGVEYDDMLKKMKAVADKNKVDIALTPVGFESINSQINDVDLSMEILDASLKGSKAGFTDLNTVSSALAQTMSIVGKENASAMEVLDTFLTSKRVGAGEFTDFAKYMPTLIAGGSNLGVDYKEVAGAFAYLTGKGQSADKATVLLENTFTALSRGEIRGRMAKAGVKVFDEDGSIRSLVDIFSDLSSLLGNFNDEQRSSILEGFGLVNKESKNAFAVLMSDTTKLRESMGEVKLSDGESDRALKFSQNSMMKTGENWAQIKNIGLELGGYILPVINVGLDLMGKVLGIVSLGLDKITEGFGWWVNKMKEGNILLLALTGAITGAALAFGTYYAVQNAGLIVDGARNVLNYAVAASTKVAAAAQWMLNTALFGCPIVWIVAGMAAVGAAVMIMWNKFEWFREGVLGAWQVIKEFGKSLFNSIISPFQQIISGIGAVGRALISLVKGDFKQAATEAKEGAKTVLKGIAGTTPVGVAVNTFNNGNYADAWNTGREKGRESFAKSKQTDARDKVQPSFEVPDGIGDIQTAGAVDYDGLMKKLAKGKGKDGTGKGAKTTLKLNDTPQNFSETAEYTAIKATMSPKVSIPAPVINMAGPDKTPVDGVASIPPAIESATNAPSLAGTDYVNPEKENILSDIMHNVRKIAAAIAIPLALSLPAESRAVAMPEPVSSVISETTNMAEYNTTSQSREIRIDNITIHIANADDKGEEEIVYMIKRVIKESLT